MQLCCFVTILHQNFNNLYINQLQIANASEITTNFDLIMLSSVYFFYNTPRRSEMPKTPTGLSSVIPQNPKPKYPKPLLNAGFVMN